MSITLDADVKFYCDEYDGRLCFTHAVKVIMEEDLKVTTEIGEIGFWEHTCILCLEIDDE